MGFGDRGGGLEAVGLGEGSHATPAVSNGRMFIRGFEHVFCLEAEKSAAK